MLPVNVVSWISSSGSAQKGLRACVPVRGVFLCTLWRSGAGAKHDTQLFSVWLSNDCCDWSSSSAHAPGDQPSATWHPAATLCWSHMSIPAQISIAQWWLRCPSAQQHFLSIFISPAYCQGWAWGRKICLLTFRQLVWGCTTHIKPVGCVGSFHLLRPHWEISVEKAKESFRLY